MAGQKEGSDIGAWLSRLGLDRYEAVFRDNDIGLDVLPKLTAEDLSGLGVNSIGHRRKLLDAAAALRAEPGAGESGGTPVPDERAAAGGAEGERRPVTVLFADLVRFTGLSAEFDAEEIHAMLGRFFEAVDAAVERQGGAIDKHIGDCVMAVFGAPVAHRNDAERAVRAAIDIHKEVGLMRDAAGRALSVHAGVASGTVVASITGSAAHRQYTVTGEAANLASRLTGLAGPNETLLSDAVRQELGAKLDAEPAGDVTVKGFDQPVRVWRLRGLREGDPAPHLFVGRRSELTQIGAVLASCRETGRGHTVYVRGEAGIGKSRFTGEIRRMASSQGFASHVGHILDFGAAKGQDAVRAVVRSMLGVSAAGLPEEAQRAAAGAIAEGHVAADRLVFLNDLLDLPQPLETRALYDAMDNAARNKGKRETAAELIRGLARRRSLLLVIEDLHWAGPTTLAHAAEWSSAIAECGAILVLTSRIEGDPLDASWRGATRGTPMMTIDLGPLRAEDATALAETFEAANKFTAVCVERSGGHPLFLEQLLRGAEEIGAGVLPGSVQSAVLARVDTLGAADKQALQAASVLGQRFTLDALRRLIASPGYGAEPLIAHYLVRREGEDYLFAHALIQEGVYASLLQARRRELHRRAASWYEERDLVLCAEHLERAEDPTAPQVYLAAARAEAEAYHHDQASRLAKRGLKLARERADIWALALMLGDLLHDAGDVQPAMTAYEKALELAEGDAERCAAWIGLAGCMRIADRFDEAFPLLDKAQTAALAQNFVPELARIHHLRGNLLFPLGDIEGCLREHRAALACARKSASLELEARALGGLGDAEYARGRMRAAHESFRKCADISREHGFGRVQVANLSMVAHTFVYLNDFKGALEVSQEAAELAARVGHHRAEIIAHNASNLVARVTGEFRDARRHSERSMELAQALGSKRFQAFGLHNLGMILEFEGRKQQALDSMRAAVALGRESGINFLGPFVLGHIAVTTGDTEERRNALAEGEEILTKGAVSHNHLWFRRYAMDAALRDANWDEADRQCAALEAYTQPEPLPWADFFIAYGRTLAAHGRHPDRQTRDAVSALRDTASGLDYGCALIAIDSVLGAGIGRADAGSPQP